MTVPPNEVSDKAQRTIIVVGSIQCDQIGRFIALQGKFSKPLATINLPKSPSILRKFF